MLLAILFAYFGYKKANESGRNGIVWAIIALASFIGAQLIIGLAIGLGIGIGSEAFGWSMNLIDEYEILINIVAIIGGLISGFLVLWYLGRTPKIDAYSEPPQPPTFDGN